jgi:hypothetical protein
MFKQRYRVNFLDEKWNSIKLNVKVDFIPRTHELVYLNSTYYRVANVIHNVDKSAEVYVIIELYTDDLNLLDKK